MAVDARGNPILSYGARGGEVSWLKQVMNWWGYYDQAHPDAALGADVYGWDIANAVEKFQQQYGIAPTGVADSATWYAIEQLASGVTPQNLQPDPYSPMPTAPYSTGDPREGTPAGPNQAPGSSPDLTRDAMARLQSVLRQYGLGDMTEWIRSKLLAGASEAEIQLELYDQPAFKARFPAIDARRQAGLSPVSPAEILDYETRGRELLRRAGLTSEQFTNSTYLQGLMVKDVSLAEVNDRVQNGLVKIQQAPAEVRNAFGSYFGTSGDVALAQFFLDPELAVPELERMATTAFVGGVGQRFNVHLAQQIAREVADTGASDQAVWQGFRQIDQIKSLFQETLAETTDLTAEQEGVQAVFGTQPGATDTLQRRAQQRTAAFSGGGGAAATDRGVVGLGTAQ